MPACDKTLVTGTLPWAKAWSDSFLMDSVLINLFCLSLDWFSLSLLFFPNSLHFEKDTYHSKLCSPPMACIQGDFLLDLSNSPAVTFLSLLRSFLPFLPLLCLSCPWFPKLGAPSQTEEPHAFYSRFYLPHSSRDPRLIRFALRACPGFSEIWLCQVIVELALV